MYTYNGASGKSDTQTHTNNWRKVDLTYCWFNSMHEKPQCIAHLALLPRNSPAQALPMLSSTLWAFATSFLSVKCIGCRHAPWKLLLLLLVQMLLTLTLMPLMPLASPYSNICCRALRQLLCFQHRHWN